MQRVRDVGRGRRDAARRGDADAHRCDDERRTRREGRQNEPGDGGDRPGDAGHPAAHAGRHRLLVEVVRQVGQGEELQDALLEGGAALVEEANEKTHGHEDSIGGLFHHSN